MNDFVFRNLLLKIEIILIIETYFKKCTSESVFLMWLKCVALFWLLLMTSTYISWYIKMILLHYRLMGIENPKNDTRLIQSLFVSPCLWFLIMYSKYQLEWKVDSLSRSDSLGNGFWGRTRLITKNSNWANYKIFNFRNGVKIHCRARWIPKSWWAIFRFFRIILSQGMTAS